MNNKFLYSAIGDNTPENREHLEKLGYEDISRHCTGKYLETTTSGGYSIFSNDLILSISSKNYTGNPALFQAVTAIRDDSDYMQWFVWDVNIFTRDYDDLILEKGTFELSEDKDFIGIYDDYPKEVHKATLEELKEHFK